MLFAALAFASAAAKTPEPMALSERVERVLRPVRKRCSRKVVEALRFEIGRLEGFELLFNEMASQRDRALAQLAKKARK